MQVGRVCVCIKIIFQVIQQSYPALHALLRAIDPEGVDPDGKLTSSVVTKLNDKLSELVSPEVVESFKQDRNERGEVWCYTQCLNTNLLSIPSARQ